MVIHIHIPLLSCCQRFGFCSVLLKHWKSFHGVWRVPSEKMVFNCPQTFLFLLCKNYKGVTIFKAYFSIHKKDIYFQSDDVSLSLNPQCLLESFFLPAPLLDTSWVLFPAQVLSFVLWSFFSCKFVQWKILFSLDRTHGELNKKDSWNSDWNLFV